MNIATYKQVKLSCGPVEEIAWIPSHMAINGKHLVMGGDITWVVQEVYPITISNVYLSEHLREDYRHQREASDV